MAEVKTVLVTSKGGHGDPYRINEEDFDEKLHKKASEAQEAAVEKTSEAATKADKKAKE